MLNLGSKTYDFAFNLKSFNFQPQNENVYNNQRRHLTPDNKPTFIPFY